VGCGAGSLTAIANEGKGNDVLCVEPDPVRASAAAARGLAVIQGDLDEPLIDAHGPFDVIVLSDVLEHLASPEPMLKLVRRGLADGGFLLLSVPNVAHWTIRLGLLAGRFEYEATGLCDATHLRWFTERSLVALLQRNGFDVEVVKHTAGTILSAYDAGLFRLVPRRTRDRTIRALTIAFPRLFGCQHVVVAKLPGKCGRSAPA
jgi:2-polyprenyl-3-methyl-5-hydroxy-6-metoxy-1,4-benzoquinol methylase